MTLLVPASRVKTVKTLLEDPKMNFLDKKRRITVSEVSAKDIIIVPFQDINLFADDFHHYEVELENKNLLEKERNSMKKNAIKLIVGSEGSTSEISKIKKGSSTSQNMIPQGGVKSPEGLMAIPITASLVNILFNKSSSGVSKIFMKDLCLCLGLKYLCSDNIDNHSDCVYTADEEGDDEEMKKEGKGSETSSIVDNTQVKTSDPTVKTSCIEEKMTNNADNAANAANTNRNVPKKNAPLSLNFKLGQQHVRVSKTLLADGFRKANQYLDSVVREYRLPLEASKLFPKKYETVGNILMIPEDSLDGPIWENLLPPPVPSSSSRIAQPTGKRKRCFLLFPLLCFSFLVIDPVSLRRSLLKCFKSCYAILTLLSDMMYS